MEDRLSQILAKPVFQWQNRSSLSITAANYCHLEVPHPKQDVAPIDIVPAYDPEQHTASQMQNPYHDNSHTFKVAIKDIAVRISNNAEPLLPTRIFRLLQRFSCYVDTISQLKTMVSEQTELIKSLRLIMGEKSGHEKALQEQVDYLTRKLFRSSSERRSDDILGQQNLFDKAYME